LKTSNLATSENPIFATCLCAALFLELLVSLKVETPKLEAYFIDFSPRSDASPFPLKSGWILTPSSQPVPSLRSRTRFIPTSFSSTSTTNIFPPLSRNHSSQTLGTQSWPPHVFVTNSI